jgi:hypothetical protein
MPYSNITLSVGSFFELKNCDEKINIVIVLVRKNFRLFFVMNTYYRFLSLCALFLAAGCATAPGSDAAKKPIDDTLAIVCTLPAAADGKGYAGTCQVPCSVNALAVNFDGIDSKRACTGPARSVTASLAITSVAQRWLGNMQGVQPEDPTRMEIVPSKTGASVARLPYGWFAVHSLREEKQPAPQQLVIRIDGSRQVRPNTDDLAIIDRAVALMPNAAVWNKQDNRQCPAGQSKISLFCALMQATTEISGGVHYRQPAMQAVREELNLVDASRIKTHRIMDYNNHPDTSLAEIHALLERAKTRVSKEIR